MSRKIAFRYNLLRGGAFYARLRALQSSPPHIRMQDDAQIKMSFSGTFGPWARDVDGRRMEIDWLRDEIQPVMIVDGTEHALGVYIPTTHSEIQRGRRSYVSIEAYDRCQRVMDTNSAQMLYWPRGTYYIDAVEQLLTAAGINTVFKTPNSAAFSEPREDWPVGTSYLQVANELLAEINYNPLWFDAMGNAVLEPASVPEASAIEHTLSDLDPGTLVVPGMTRRVDLFNAPNVFIVVCANPDKGSNLTATAVNDNPQSPLSVPRRGRQIVQVTQLNNIASAAELQAYAERQRNDSLLTGETLNVTTGLLPGWGVSDVVAVHYGDMNSICISRAYDMELKAGGKMSHVLEKVVYALE